MGWWITYMSEQGRWYTCYLVSEVSIRVYIYAYDAQLIDLITKKTTTNYQYTYICIYIFITLQGQTNREEGHSAVVHARVSSCTVPRGLPHNAHCFLQFWSQACQLLYQKSHSESCTLFQGWFSYFNIASIRLARWIYIPKQNMYKQAYLYFILNFVFAY